MIIKPLRFFGDQQATQSTYDFRGDKESCPGLPVNEPALLKMAQLNYQRYRLSFWCNSYPLMGAQALIDDSSWLQKPPRERWIPYHKMKPRWPFFNQDLIWQITKQQMDSIIENYFEMNEFIHYEFGGKFVVLPLSAYIFDRTLNLNLDIHSRLKEYDWRMVDLSPLDSLSDEQAFTKENTLTEQAYRLIEPKIFEFVDN